MLLLAACDSGLLQPACQSVPLTHQQSGVLCAHPWLGLGGLHLAQLTLQVANTRRVVADLTQQPRVLAIQLSIWACLLYLGYAQVRQIRDGRQKRCLPSCFTHRKSTSPPTSAAAWARAWRSSSCRLTTASRLCASMPVKCST